MHVISIKWFSAHKNCHTYDFHLVCNRRKLYFSFLSFHFPGEIKMKANNECQKNPPIQIFNAIKMRSFQRILLQKTFFITRNECVCMCVCAVLKWGLIGFLSSLINCTQCEKTNSFFFASHQSSNYKLPEMIGARIKSNGEVLIAQTVI